MLHALVLCERKRLQVIYKAIPVNSMVSSFWAVRIICEQDVVTNGLQLPQRSSITSAKDVL